MANDGNFKKIKRSKRRDHYKPLVGLDLESEHFPGQKADENIVVLVHRHPMTLNRVAQLLIGLGLITVAVFAFFGRNPVNYFILLIYILGGGYFASRTWYLWKKSQYILTNQRVVAFDQLGFFSRVVNEAPLYQIQNVTFEIKGISRTLFDYGPISIRMDGEKAAWVDFIDVPHPAEIQKRIMAAVQKYAGAGQFPQSNRQDDGQE